MSLSYLRFGENPRQTTPKVDGLSHHYFQIKNDIFAHFGLHNKMHRQKWHLRSIFQSLFHRIWPLFVIELFDLFNTIIKDIILLVFLFEKQRWNCCVVYFLSIKILPFEFLRHKLHLCQLQLMRKYSNDGGKNYMTQLWFILERYTTVKIRFSILRMYWTGSKLI